MKKAGLPSKKPRPSAIEPRTPKLPALSAGTQAPAIVDEAALLTHLRELIQSARQRIATVANSTTTMLYWHLGRRLLADSLQDERAPY